MQNRKSKSKKISQAAAVPSKNAKQRKALAKLTPEALAKELLLQRETMRKLRFAHALNPLQNPMRIQHTRRYIARLKTRQNQYNQTTS